MKVLIVHAHPEPTSYNAAMTRQAVQTLQSLGHKVVVSDLYRMGFDPVSDRRNFLGQVDPVRLKMQAEELHAAAIAGFAADVQEQIDRLLDCDLLILQFPIWWLGMPAILKGWIDRVFACGIAYGGGRYFSTGALSGKRAMCALTLGGPREVYSADGLYDEVEQILFPIHRGIFGFTGCTVLEPFAVYGPNRMDEEGRRAELARYAHHLEHLDAARILPMPQ